MMSNRNIVIDSGSYRTRVGVSGNDEPEETFRTVVGRETTGGSSDVFVGIDALERPDGLQLSYSVDKYIMRSMNDMCCIWEYCCLDVLGCDTLEECPVLLTDGPIDADAKTKSRARLAEIMFEKCSVPSFYVAMQPYLSLIGLNHTTGLVLDVGDSMACAVPVVDGAVVSEGIVTSDSVSGRHITDYLMKILNQQNGVSIADREIVTRIKEDLGYVAFDYEEEFKLADSVTKDFTLPDGQVIHVGTERFRCTEPLFQPSILDTELRGGLHMMVQDSIQRCDVESRAALYGGITLAGGSTLLHKITDRIKQQVKSLASDVTEVRVLTPPTRAWSAWLGGSILSEWEGFPALAVTKQEYRENGAAIMDKKCKN